MIGDIAKRSRLSPKVLIPVEDLLGNATGGRIPEVHGDSLSVELAQRAVDACPTSALTLTESATGPELALNYGECIACQRCVQASGGAITMAANFTLCGVRKNALVRRWSLNTRAEIPQDDPVAVDAARSIRALLKRALNIRQVDAGSCNGCEGEIVALSNPYYDLERFGIHFVASPKHADMLLVTGPVTRNMAEAVKHAYEATPAPKLVVAVGACGCSGGIFAGSYAVTGAVESVIPVDTYIPGCPPTPAMLLTGILQTLQRR